MSKGIVCIKEVQISEDFPATVLKKRVWFSQTNSAKQEIRYHWKISRPSEVSLSTGGRTILITVEAKQLTDELTEELPEKEASNKEEGKPDQATTY